MSIMSYNGGTVVAMAGKDAVCIASDLRIGEQMTTVAVNQNKVHKIADQLYIGLSGFASDAETVLQKIRFRTQLYELRENRKLKPKVLATMISNLCYQHRFGSFFTEPLVAGLDPLTGAPFICSMDTIGCISNPVDFVAIGCGAEYALGCAENFWRPDLSTDDLFEATAQTMLAAMERDASSGWGVVVYLVTKDKTVVKTLHARMD